MKRKNDAAAEITHTAAEIKDAIMDKVAPLLDSAADALDQGKTQIAPLAHDAKVKGAKVAANAMNKAHPILDDALDKVTPAVDTAREKIQHDLLPKLNDLLKAAAEADVVPTKREMKQIRKDVKQAAKDARKKSHQAVRSFKGEIEPRKKRSKAKSVGLVACALALIAAAGMALRKYLAQTDESGWAAHSPSDAYTCKKAEAEDFINDKVDDARHAFGEFTDAAKEKVEDLKDAVGDAADAAQDKAEDLKDTLGDAADDAKRAANDAKEVVADKVHEVSDDAAAKADQAVEEAGETRQYGEGAYVGNEPPEGFVIKGNERSMKYHTEGNEGFERTIPDVWFNSEEAAEAHGFTKAQR